MVVWLEVWFCTVGGCIFFVVVVNSSFVALVLLGGWGLGSTIGGCSFVTVGGWGLGSQLEVVLL